ncbi:MAG: hypothetical protein ACOCYA_02755, partial [Spirochaetota bacterium]
MNTKTPTPNGSDDPPRWDLNRIYPGFDSPKYRKDIAELTRFLEEAGTAVDRLLKTKTGKDRAECIRVFNLVYDYHEELEDFAYSVYSTDTNNHRALQELNKLEEMMVRFHTDRVRFRSVLAEVPGLPEDYRFFLEEELFLAGKQMTPKEESLAADLSRAG